MIATPASAPAHTYYWQDRAACFKELLGPDRAFWRLCAAHDLGGIAEPRHGEARWICKISGDLRAA